MKKSVKNKKKMSHLSKRSLLTVLLMIIISFTAYNILPLRTTGFATMIHRLNYSDNINLTVDDDQIYTWSISNYGKLKSIELEGSISKYGSARVYLEHNGKSYLIFDSLKLSETASLTDLITENTISNEDTLITIINNSGGRKNINKVFEFDVDNVFNWDVDYSKICTKWNINDISICNGAEDCCDLVGLDSSGKWNNSLYLSYGRYGTELSNIVKLQIIYANYSLDIENPYSDIVYSNVNEFKAEFYEETVNFKDICIDTCLLSDLEEKEYKLIFVIENATMDIKNIHYSVEKEIEISDNIPELIKNINNITIYKNEDIKIDLNQYFTDKDNDNLTYSAYKADNLSILIKDSIARIVPSFNFTGKRYTYFTASDGYYNMTSNAFKVEVIEKPLKQEEVKVSERLIKPKVVINRPVRWIKKVNVSDSVINLSINISSNALNISIKDTKEDKIINEDNIKINDSGIVKNASKYKAEKRIEQIEKSETELEDKKEEITAKTPAAKKEIGSINRELNDLQNEKNKLTGYAIANKEKGLLTKFIEWFFDTKITGYAIVKEGTSNTTSIIIEDIVEEIEIEYYTEGPISEEENISNGKKIVVSSEVHYEDILAYTYLDDIAQSSIKLYWIVNNSRVLVNTIDYYDDNNNGLIDYIEWIVPSLSNQTYEVIIEISNAEHLDANKNFIADIYPYVYAQDDNWTLVSNGEYIRITFESPLSSTRDITIHARSNENSSIEVYTENGNEIITTFENILEENTHKVYLTNLEESYETFDLKINGNIEFDYIVDPDNYAVTTCGTLNDSGQTYTLQNNISTTGSCFNISASSITIDFNGFNITGNDVDLGFGTAGNDGVYSNGYDNIVIRNGGIYDFTHGIYLIDGASSDQDIINMIVNSNAQVGIYLDNSDYTTISDCTLSENYAGLFTYTGCSYLNVENVVANDNSGTAFFIDQDTQYSNFTNITANSNAEGIGFANEARNNIISNSSFSSNSYGINVGSGSDNLIRDSSISSSSSSDVYVASGSNNITLLNVSYSSEDVQGGDTKLIRKWYYKAYVNDTDGYNVQNANVSIYNVSGNLMYNMTTDSNGYTPTYNIIDYVNKGGTKTYYSNYTITAVNPSYNDKSVSYNVSANENNLAHNIEMSAAGKTTCGTLPDANTVYTLQNSISGISGTCFTIGANNIILDFNTYSITGDDSGSTDYGVYSSGYNDTTIKNGEIYDFWDGIYLITSYNNNITNITSNSNGASGAKIVIGENNKLTNIIAIDNHYGIEIQGDNNILINVTANAQGQDGIWCSGSNNNITNSTLSSVSGYGIQFFSGSNNIITNTNIPSSGVQDVYLTSTSTNNIFLNATYTTELVDAGSSLTRKWYYRAYVNDTDGNNVQNANVSIYQVMGSLMYNMTTDATGYTPTYNIIDYENMGGTKTYYSNYTITAVNSTYNDKSVSYNVSANENNLAHNIEMSAAGKTACGILSDANTIYTLQNDISTTGTCFNIIANGITLDFNGYFINNTSPAGAEYGVTSTGYNGTTIKNGYIYDFGIGISSTNGYNGNFSNMTVYDNNDFSSNNIFGIYLTGGQNNSIIDNNVTMINTNWMSGTEYGIYLSSSSNNTIQDNTANSNGAHGIYLSSSSNNIIRDNTANSNSIDYGIGLSSGSNNNQIINNTANSNTYGIGFVDSNNNQIINNTANSNKYGLLVQTSSNNNITNNNIWNCSTGGSYACISVSSNSQSNTFTDNKINLSAGKGIIVDGDHNVFRNTNITNIAGIDVHIEDNEVNNTFINMTWDETETVDSGGQLIRKWYYRAYVNDTNGNNVGNANVSIYNVSGNLMYNMSTDATGYTSIYNIIDYINNGGTKTYYSNYTINASKNGFSRVSHNYNVTANENNFKDVFTLVNFNLTNCGTLSEASTTYTLQNDINTTTTCLTIGANNITIDFNGFNLTGGNNYGYYGVNNNGYNDSTIMNGGIYDFYVLIYLTNNRNNNVTNIISSSNVSSDSYGLDISSSDNNTITNFTISGIKHCGICSYTAANNNKIINSNLSSNEEYGIYLTSNSNNNLIINNIINNNSQYGVYLSASSNNNITNTNISNSGTKDVYLTSTSTNNVFLNSTYNISKELIDAGSELIRKWYYKAYVNDTDGNNIPGANVSIYNVSGNLMYNMSTDTTGYTSIYNIIDYVNNGGTKTYYSNYTLYAESNVYNKISHVYNVSANKNNPKDVFTLDVVLPAINKVNITPTIGPSGTVFNISVNTTDNIQIDTVIAYIQKPDENNTANITLSLTNNLYNGTWNSSDKADGTYTIDIIANDTSGNQKELENAAIIALSANAQSTFVNSSINITANTSITINAIDETNTWLNITTSANTTASITIAEYSNNIEAVSALGVSELGKYISIIVDNETNNNISYAEIRVYYTDAQLTTANLTESSLRLYKFNTSSNLWYVINPGGVNTNLNYVWGNISRFSSFGIFGDKVSSTSTPPSRTSTSRAKAICTPEWDCSEWSECIDRIQTRTCKIIGTCYNYQNEPETTKECGIERKIGIDLSKTEDEIGFFDAELDTKDNDLDIKLIISSKEGKEIEDLEIELNINKEKSTKILDYIGPFSIKDRQTIKKTYNAKRLKNGEYEVNIKLYKKGKKIEELTEKIIINKKEATGGAFKITGNVIALDRKGINEKKRFIPLAILFIVLFSLILIKHIKKRWE